jgi:hypothetical protein
MTQRLLDSTTSAKVEGMKRQWSRSLQENVTQSKDEP